MQNLVLTLNIWIWVQRSFKYHIYFLRMVSVDNFLFVVLFWVFYAKRVGLYVCWLTKRLLFTCRWRNDRSCKSCRANQTTWSPYCSPTGLHADGCAHSFEFVFMFSITALVCQDSRSVWKGHCWLSFSLGGYGQGTSGSLSIHVSFTPVRLLLLHSSLLSCTLLQIFPFAFGLSDMVIWSMFVWKCTFEINFLPS